MQSMMRKSVLWVALAATIWLTWQTSRQEEDLVKVNAVRVVSRQASLEATVSRDKVSAVHAPEDQGFHLSARTKESQPYFNLFSAPARSKQLAAIEAVKPEIPSAPLLPFKYMGVIEESGESKVILEDGDDVFALKAGDRFGEHYKLISINKAAGSIEILYLPMNIMQTLVVRNESEL